MTPDQADAYRPHLHTAFAVEGFCEIRMESVTPFEDAATEGFSLLFSGPRDTLIPQGLRVLDHPALGRMELFLVPIQGPQDCRSFEAVFNRLKPQASSPGGA